MLHIFHILLVFRNFFTPLFSVFHTAQKVKFSSKDFFSKCDQSRSFLRIWSHLLKKFLMENFIFCAVPLGFYLHKKIIPSVIWLRLNKKINFWFTIYNVLRDLVPFVQFKQCEKHPWGSVTFSKVAGFFSLQLY